VLNGKISGLGVNPSDPATGNFANNLPLPGASIEIYATDRTSGARQGAALHRKTVGPDGMWGPFTAQAGTAYEFVVSAPGYATAHIYRSPFARSSDLVHLRAERLAEADRSAGAVVAFTRPRGYFDPPRDTMRLDGQTRLPGVTPGAGVASW
jgi:triacylglycerol lipase